jgi:hypothetical protein
VRRDCRSVSDGGFGHLYALSPFKGPYLCSWTATVQFVILASTHWPSRSTMRSYSPTRTSPTPAVFDEARRPPTEDVAEVSDLSTTCDHGVPLVRAHLAVFSRPRRGDVPLILSRLISRAPARWWSESMPPQRFHPMGRDARRTSRLFVPLFPVVACTGHSVWWKCRIRLSNGGLSMASFDFTRSTISANIQPSMCRLRA